MRAVEQSVVRPGEAAAPAPRQQLVAIVEQGHRAQRQRHRHRADEGHVGHRLARHQAVHRRRRDDHGCQHAGAPVHEPRGHQVDRVDAEHAREHERRTHRPLGTVRQRHLAGIAARQADARDVHADAHQPERQHRLGPEHVQVARRARPPQADEVAPVGHLARDLGVVRLPRVPQAVRAGERQVQQQAEEDHADRHLALGEAIEEASMRAAERIGMRAAERIGLRAAGVVVDVHFASPLLRFHLAKILCSSSRLRSSAFGRPTMSSSGVDRTSPLTRPMSRPWLPRAR